MYLITKRYDVEAHSVNTMNSLTVKQDKVQWKDSAFGDRQYTTDEVIGFFDDDDGADYLNSILKKRQFSDD